MELPFHFFHIDTNKYDTIFTNLCEIIIFSNDINSARFNSMLQEVVQNLYNLYKLNKIKKQK